MGWCKVKKTLVIEIKDNLIDSAITSDKFSSIARNKLGLMMHEDDDGQFIFPANLREMKGKKEAFISCFPVYENCFLFIYTISQ